MPEWLWIIIVGGIVIGLLGLVYNQMLTKSEHSEICKKNTEGINNDLKETLKAGLQDIKNYFDLKIENVVLKEIRKINGKS